MALKFVQELCEKLRDRLLISREASLLLDRSCGRRSYTMVSLSVPLAQPCVGRFTPGIINSRWGQRLRTERSSDHNAVVDSATSPMASELATEAHPDDLLDQAMHDQGKCDCFGK
jgi:hypothetical protein